MNQRAFAFRLLSTVPLRLLTSGGLTIVYYVSPNGHTLTGAVGADAASGPIFTIVLTDGVSDTYTITMIGTVDGGATKVVFDPAGGYDFEGGNHSWLAFFKAGDDGSKDLLLTPAVGGLRAGDINTNAGVAGVNSPSVGPSGGPAGTRRKL